MSMLPAAQRLPQQHKERAQRAPRPGAADAGGLGENLEP